MSPNETNPAVYKLRHFYSQVGLALETLVGQRIELSKYIGMHDILELNKKITNNNKINKYELYLKTV